MTGGPGVDHPIELHLPDGGHVVLMIEDVPTRLSSDCDRLIETLLRVDGAEHDVERAIRADADAMGLRCATSGGHHPTVISLRR